MLRRGEGPRIHADVSVIDVFARVRKFNRSMDWRVKPGNDELRMIQLKRKAR
jgi:hypothetical protein